MASIPISLQEFSIYSNNFHPAIAVDSFIHFIPHMILLNNQYFNIRAIQARNEKKPTIAFKRYLNNIKIFFHKIKVKNILKQWNNQNEIFLGYKQYISYPAYLSE